MLEPLMAFFTQRGRLPVKGELAEEQEIKGEFKSYSNALKLILEATDEKEWEAIANKRSEELSIYLALSKFGDRPTMRKLPRPVREDIKALFGNYKRACSIADLMLLSLRDLEEMAEICAESKVGQKHKNYFLVHVSALEKLDPLLRLYEGCASRAIGKLDNANIIRFSLVHPQISYLYYPHFDTEPHPALHTGMFIDLGNLEVRYRDHEKDEDPPVLHYKDSLVGADYPLYEKFAKLTAQEKDWGLLDDLLAIRRRKGWLACLKDHCATLQGHRLYWRKDADPNKVKALRFRIASKRNQRREELDN